MSEIISPALVTSPDNFEFWSSSTGIGTPDSNPVDWVLYDTNTEIDGGSGDWLATEDGVPADGTFYISRYFWSGNYSDWSSVLQAS